MGAVSMPLGQFDFIAIGIGDEGDQVGAPRTHRLGRMGDVDPVAGENFAQPH